MTRQGGNHGVSKSGGRGGRVVGNNNGGELSKRRNDHFEFQISFPSIFPPLRPKFGSKPIITVYEVGTIKVRFISPKGTTRQWFGGISTKKK